MKNNSSPKIPMTCYGVKCMIEDCKDLASHKIGEENIWDKNREEVEYDKFEASHNLTTYLCDKHFDQIMSRDESYSDKDERFKEEK